MDEFERKDSMRIPVETLIGQKVSATYLDSRSNPTKIYHGNPLIEALPPEYTRQQVAAALKVKIPFDDDERNLEPHHRMHCVQSALHFFQPLPIHFDLQEKFARAIRGGYLPRNPTHPTYWPQVREAVTNVEAASALPTWASLSQEHRSPFRRRVGHGFAVIGWPGLGKTTSIDEILTGLYPQVIVHDVYRGKKLPLEQIVWLKMDLPHDGSLRGLCDGFFASVDQILGTDYRSLFVRRRKAVNVLLPDMANIALIHGLGILVIDELQHLSEAASGGINKMMNFFVTLNNALRLPIVLVGTPRAIPLLTKELRSIRRAEGQGDLIFERMAFDAIWQKFVTELWRYEYTRHHVELSERLSKCLHYASQGITDFAVKIFMLAQIRAITTKEERITENIINSVTDDSLRLAAPILTALREGRELDLKKYEDLGKVELGSLISKAAATCFVGSNEVPDSKEANPTFDLVDCSRGTNGTTSHVPSLASPVLEEVLPIGNGQSHKEAVQDDNSGVARTPRTRRPAGRRTAAGAAKRGMLAVTAGIVDPSGEKMLTALREAGLNRPADEFGREVI